MFVEANFLYTTNGLDESYFLYFEELELSKKISPGQRLAWCRSSMVYHVGGGSSSVKGVEYEKIKQASISAFIYTGRYCPYYLPSVMMARLLGLLLRGLFRFNPKLPIAVVEGMVMFFRKSRP
jgi:GT2 family glycosyltransferase